MFLPEARRRRPRCGRHVCRRSPRDRGGRGGDRAVLRKPRVVFNHGPKAFSKFPSTCVTHDGRRGYTLDQEEAIRDLLREYGLFKSNSTWTPIDDSYYDPDEGDAEIIGTPSARPGPTVRQFQSHVVSQL
uniref:Uncharacterized protein n=1 Tax=Peronospora matthiolae TaxID=2874970 RepID=A0AAV1UPC2_9STRA